jgi:hypothetical protein
VKNRLLALLLILALVSLPAAAAAAPAVEAELPSRWLGILADLLQSVFAAGAAPAEDEPPAAPPVDVAPQPAAEPQESNPGGDTEQRPGLDPIG